ncbi:MAG: helix-turn-helix domain-containing protein [Acidaminobacteraceae bacterium]
MNRRDNMLDNKKNKGKHLTIHDRTFIEDALAAGHILRDIVDRLGKDTTTVSKEIKRSRIFKESQTQFFGGCINRSKCHKKHLCNDNCNELCKKPFVKRRIA